MASGTRPKGASKKSRSRAARQEKAPETKTVEWKGIKLELPAEAPEGAFVRFEFDRALSGGAQDMRPVMVLLLELLGEAQLSEARDKVETFGDINQLVDLVLGAYGLGPGESQASQDS